MSNEKDEAPKQGGISTDNRQESDNERPFVIRIIRRIRQYLGRNDSHLVIATYLLGIGTLWLAYLALQSIDVTHQALLDQRAANGKQVARMDSQLAIAQHSAESQSRFSRATLDSTSVQLSIARETMQRQLRAYVYVEPIEDTTLPLKGTFYRVYKIKNSGQTPAYRLTSWYLYKTAPVNPMPTFEGRPNAEDSSITTLTPGDEGTGFVVFPELSDFELNKITKNKAALFIWGQVKYTDAFDARRFTNFRYRLTLSKGILTVFACKEGNESN